MAHAEKTGTERRKKRRKLYHRATWIAGGTAILAALIWLPAGPLQTYKAHKPSETEQRTATQRAPVQKLCPDMTTQEKRSCMITSDKWSNWVRMESGARDYSLKPCHSAGVKSDRTDVGATKLRFQAVSGEDEVKYQLFPLDTDCFALGF